MGETADRLWGRTARALALAAGLVVVWMALAATDASAATLSVCPHGCRYSQISDAVGAARDGDTVRVSPGTYRGGFAITKDLTLAGSGALATVIRGGGPVITVGTELGASEPTVGIRDVTITHGLTQGAFGDTVEALGGGVYIPPADGLAPGATVTFSDRVITGNTDAPAISQYAGFSCGPTGDCTFAHAGGGGVDTWGNLTVDHTAITNNQAAGALTSDANGGGLYSQDGTLTVRDSVIAGNRATVANGRFAEGAGIMADTFFSPPGTCVAPAPACALTVQRTIVSHNTSSLRSTFPVFGDDGEVINMVSNAGGIHVGDSFPTTVQDTAIVDNAATASDPSGEPNAIDGAMLVGASPLTLRDASVSFNRTLTTNATTADSGANGGPLELAGGGQLTHVSMIGNVSKTSSPGDAAIIGGVGIFANDNGVEPVTVRDSVFRDHSAEADSQAGLVQGL